MAITYEPIATTTLSTATASVTFSSISGSYTDLILVCNIKGSVISTPTIRLNGDSGSNYSQTNLYGRYNSGVGGTNDISSERYSNATFAYGTGGVSYSATNYGNDILQFKNYSNTNTYKTILGRANIYEQANYCGVGSSVILWRSTSAITSIVYSANSGTFVSGSTFSLYGIKAA